MIISKHIIFAVCLNFFFFIDFREREEGERKEGGGGEREREKCQFVFPLLYVLAVCFLCVP